MSRTVIMQLVFECSYHTNVDRLHFQTCFLGFFVSTVYQFSFHLFLRSALRQAALSVQLTFECPAHLILRQTPVFGCKVTDNMENKNSVIVMLFPYSCHVVNDLFFFFFFFLQTCNHKWEVEHFVCLISTKRDEEKDLYKSIVWPFHSQDLRCHDGRVIPYQCLNLYFHLRQFYFVNHIISFTMEIKKVLVHSPTLPSPNAFSIFRKKFKWYKEIFFQCIQLNK